MKTRTPRSEGSLLPSCEISNRNLANEHIPALRSPFGLACPSGLVSLWWREYHNPRAGLRPAESPNTPSAAARQLADVLEEHPRPQGGIPVRASGTIGLRRGPRLVHPGRIPPRTRDLRRPSAAFDPRRSPPPTTPRTVRGTCGRACGPGTRLGPSAGGLSHKMGRHAIQHVRE